MIRPEISEIHEALSENNSLIVHFSGCPKGVGKEQKSSLYPLDLKHVISGGASSGLSCSTVKPGDIFCGMRRNALGNIGVIIAPKNGESIVAACFEDCGSYIDEDGNRVAYTREIIERLDLESSIINRKFESHNEWVIKNFDTKGIFAIDPYEVTVLKTVPCEDPSFCSEEFIPDSTYISAIKVQFSDQKIYSFIGGNICILRDEKFVPVSVTDIYA